MRSCRQPLKGNIELPCLALDKEAIEIREKGHLATSPKTYGFNEVQKIHQGKQFVRSDPFCFIKLSYLLFLYKVTSLLIISRRLLLFNVLGNVTSSLLLCGSIRDINETCKSRSTTLFIPTPKIYHVTMKPSEIM